jgi:transposase-like protein
MKVHRHSAYEVSKRLGIATDTLYQWARQYSKPQALRQEERSQTPMRFGAGRDFLPAPEA